MKKSKLIIILLLLYGYVVQAQAPGSSTVYGGPLSTVGIATGGTVAEFSETLYIGPGDYVIDGSWDIYSKNVVIDSLAIINGSGSIRLFNPSAGGGLASRTFIDGNNLKNSIETAIVLNNASGMEITEIPFPADLVAAGFTNKSNNTVYAGKDLRLATDGADIWLDADAVGDLRFDANATISNYSISRMIITNNVNISHMVKDTGATSFFYPVGKADADYTPASITGTGQYHVSVTDYTPAEPMISNADKGMYRTWHVYGDTASSMTLTHNIATNGSAYVDNYAYITRYQGAGTWFSSSNSDYAGRDGMHTNDAAIPENIPASASDVGSYLTKSSAGSSVALPVKLISFVAKRVNQNAELKWITAGEINNKGFAIEYSMNGADWQQAGYVNSLTASGNTNATLTYNFTHGPLSPGVNFYRLRIEDTYGGIEYSGVRMVKAEGTLLVSVFPNPFVSEIFIAGLDGNERLQLYDAAGKLVRQQVASAATGNRLVSLQNLPAGMYVLQVIKPDGTLSQHQLIRQKN